MSTPSSREVLIWLNSLGVSHANIHNLIQNFDHLSQLWIANPNYINSIKTIKPEILSLILKYRNQKTLSDLFYVLGSQNIRPITFYDEEYPKTLNYINDYPKVLYTKGNILEEDELAIGIVGARKATSYGKWACEKFTRELVDMGVTIVSGVAEGIDSVAHKTALDLGGRTIGVLGNGLDKVYPSKNKYLYEGISKNGALITEFPLGTLPLAYNFPQRNRIIAGMSLGTIVIEAKEKSGSLITAHYAMEQGKEVFALPGNINNIYSGGTNRLIKDGARPLLDLDDIIEEIYELQLLEIHNKKIKRDYSCLSNTELKIVKLIEEGPIHSDIISYKTGIDITTVISIMTILELKGFIKELSSRTFTIC
ncbi:MAG: DNA-protecting protein DprA [Tissierellia bacterium]|nr:DNA-protecting protein DprA [Tissierellia bacterium]